MKRILTILLSVCLALLSIQGFVLAADADGEAEAVQPNTDLLFAKRLGLFSESLNEGAVLTRRDLAKIYFDILIPTYANEEYIELEKAFTDIEETDFFISAIANIGIMSGVGNGRFEPARAVSYNELLKSMLVFLGYENEAESRGVYPTGYLIAGNKYGFSKLAPADSSYSVTPELAAAMFKLALRVDLNNYWHISDEYAAYRLNRALKNTNYLAFYKDIIVSEGIVTANYVIDLYNYSKLDYFSVKIDDKKVTLSDAALDMNNKLGYRVMYAYDYNDGDTPEVLYWEDVNTNVLTVDGSDIIGLSGNRTGVRYYNERGRELTAGINGAFVVYNGALCTSYDESTLNPFAGSYLDGGVTFVDNDNDDVADLVIVDAFDSFVTERVADGKVFNKYTPAEAIDIKDVKDGEIVVENVLGDTIPIASIAAGDVINISRDINGAVRRIVVTVDTYTGTLEEFEMQDGKLQRLVVNGLEFDGANSVNRNPQLSLLKSGEQIKLYFNKDMKVSDVEFEEFDSYKIGYLVAAANKSKLSGSVQMKIFTQGGQMTTVDLKEFINISREGDRMRAADLLNPFGARTVMQDAKEAKRQPIKYKVNNATGELTDLLLVDESIDELQDGFYRFSKYDGIGATPWYLTSMGSFKGELLLSGATVVFAVPDEADRYNDEKYTATSPSAFFKQGNGNGAFSAYGSKAYNPVAEIVVSYSTAGTTLSDDVMIVTGSSKVLNENGEEVFLIKGLVKGNAREYTGKKEIVLTGPDDSAGNPTVPDVGDILNIAVNSEGVFGKVEFIFDASERQFYGAKYASNPTHSDYYADIRFQYGTVMYLDDLVFTIESVDAAAGTVSRESFPLSSFRYYKHEQSGSRKQLTVMNTVALTGDIHEPGMGTKVLAYTPKGYGDFIIVFDE